MNTNIFDETDLEDFVESGPVVNTGDLTPVFSRTLFTGQVDANFQTSESGPPVVQTAAANFSDLRLEATLNPSPIDITATIYRVVQRFQYGVFQCGSAAYCRNQLQAADPSCGEASTDGDLSEITVPGAVIDIPDASANYVPTGAPNFDTAQTSFDSGPFPVDVEEEYLYPAGITFAEFMATHGTPRVNVSLFSEASATLTTLGVCANVGPAQATTQLFFFFGEYELEVDWDVVIDPEEEITGDLSLEAELDSPFFPYVIDADLELEAEISFDPREIEGDLSLEAELSGWGMEIIGDLSLEIELDPVTVYSADASGIYQIEWGKRNDTLYDRDSSADLDVETVDVAIPRPFGKIGFIGG